MEADAKAYDEVSALQIEAGSRFIDGLNLSPRDKVLDMGCGTGHLTKYIADIVGPHGLAVGVDPDAERIKIAQEKCREVGNLQFCVGSSAMGFPHENEPYYDVHISTNAFHWVPCEEKIIYIQKAHLCLKPGGRLAIWCVAQSMTDDEAAKASFHSLSEEGCRDFFKKIGLFNDVLVEQRISQYPFKSFEEITRWFKATTHKDLDDYPKVIEKFVIMEDDGQVKMVAPHLFIIARKNWSK